MRSCKGKFNFGQHSSVGSVTEGGVCGGSEKKKGKRKEIIDINFMVFILVFCEKIGFIKF